MRITSNVQVTIPQEIHKPCGLLPQTQVEFREEEGKVVLKGKSPQTQPWP